MSPEALTFRFFLAIRECPQSGRVESGNSTIGTWKRIRNRPRKTHIDFSGSFKRVKEVVKFATIRDRKLDKNDESDRIDEHRKAIILNPEPPFWKKVKLRFLAHLPAFTINIKLGKIADFCRISRLTILLNINKS